MTIAKYSQPYIYILPNVAAFLRGLISGSNNINLRLPSR